MQVLCVVHVVDQGAFTSIAAAGAADVPTSPTVSSIAGTLATFTRAPCSTSLTACSSPTAAAAAAATTSAPSTRLRTFRHKLWPFE